MYRDGTELKVINLVINNNYGGMGDMIARLPAFLYTLSNHPHINFDIYVYDFLSELYSAALSGFKDRARVYPRSELEARREEIYASGRLILDFTPVQISSSKNHLTEYAFAVIENRIPARGSAWNYPKLELDNVDVSRYNVPVRYGVLTTGHTARVREWRPQYSYEVAEWMVQHNITPVYLGKRSNDFGVEVSHGSADLPDEAIHPQGIDLRDQTSLLEAAKIMSSAKFVAGVDNGLLHLASMTDVPTIWGFTTILPHTRLPFRHGSQKYRTLTVLPEPTLACRFCQTKQNFVPPTLKEQTKGIGHDYRLCLYDDYECTKHLTAGKFIDRIKQVTNYKGLGARMGR